MVKKWKNRNDLKRSIVGVSFFGELKRVKNLDE